MICPVLRLPPPNYLLSYKTIAPEQHSTLPHPKIGLETSTILSGLFVIDVSASLTIWKIRVAYSKWLQQSGTNTETLALSESGTPISTRIRILTIVQTDSIPIRPSHKRVPPRCFHCFLFWKRWCACATQGYWRCVLALNETLTNGLGTNGALC